MTIKRNRFGAGDEENLRLIVEGLEKRINKIDPEAIKDALINSANIDSIVNVDVDENSSKALKEAGDLAKTYIAVRNAEALKLEYAGKILEKVLEKFEVDDEKINDIFDKINNKVIPSDMFEIYEGELEPFTIFQLKEAGDDQIDRGKVWYETKIEPGVENFIKEVLSGGAFGRTKRRRKTSKRKTSSRKTLKKRKKVKRRSS